MPIENEADPEENLQVSDSRLSKSTTNLINVGQYCTPTMSTTSLHLSQSTKGGNVVLPMKDLANYHQEAMLGGLLKGVYQKLEEIEQKSVTKLEEIIERRKVQDKETERQVAKSITEMQETIKLQRRETRRRLERLEKKTNP